MVSVWDAFLNGDLTPGGAWFSNVTGLTNYFNVAAETPAAWDYYETYVTSASVRAAIGVGNQVGSGRHKGGMGSGMDLCDALVLWFVIL